MAIAFRSAGVVATRDVGSQGNPIAVPTPAGFAAGDLLLMLLIQDSNTNESAVPGWTALVRQNSGFSNDVYAPPKTVIYQRIATGTEGSSVSVNFSTAYWPNGNPYVGAVMLSYTGVDPNAPVEAISYGGSSGPAPALLTHQQMGTAEANAWLVTIRTASSTGSVFTATDSVGTDVARATIGALNELTTVWFDSNAPLAQGLQTQRSTTLSGAPTDGTGQINLVLKPASPAGATVALAQTANVTATANGATGVPAEQPWSATCGQGSAPFYTWAVDWALAGFAADGKILNSNAFLETGDLTGWAGSNSTVSYNSGSVGLRPLRTIHVVPNGSSSSGGVNENPHTLPGTITPGNKYVVDCWVYSATGWTDVRACVDWSDVNDVFLSSGLGSASTVPAGVWTHLRQTLTAPANASRASARFRWGSTPASTTTFDVWGLVIMDPTATETRILPDATAVIQNDIVSAVTFTYGRDQNRQLTPAKLGTGGFTLTNKDRVYSPEYAAGPLFGTLDAARPVRGQVVYNGVPYNLFAGYLNDYNVTATRQQRDVAFTVQDALSLVQQTPVSTGLYLGIRTGAAINVILDAVGWKGARDIDPGSTIMPYWWLNNVNAPAAIDDLVLSEGAPAVAYAAPDGTFVFRDRAHRVLRSQSTSVQASYSTGQLGVCASPAPSGLSIAESPAFTYSHGWRDIVNSVTFQVTQRAPNPAPTAVWSSPAPLSLALGQSVTISASGSDPFYNAITPVAGVDYIKTGSGTVQVTLNRTSGQTVLITYLAVGGSVVLNKLQLRATAWPVAQTVTVAQTDSTSISQHGQQNYPQQCPWAGAEDAYAIAEVILLRYAQRRPIVEFTLAASDPIHYVTSLNRQLSDLVNVENDELGINAPYFVEHIAHNIQRMNNAGQPPVHSVTLSCEAQINVLSAPAFTFDQRGAGFDNGAFSPLAADSPSNVWIWDTQSVFNVSEFAT